MDDATTNELEYECSPLIPARVAAQRLGCSEIVLQEVAYSNRLPMTVATATRMMWVPEDSLPAYEIALAERDDR